MIEDRPSTPLPNAAPAREGGARHLLMARIVEQGALGLGSLLLARRLGIDGFAALSAVFVFNSFAVLASDFGLGLAVLRAPLGSVGLRTLHHLRWANVGVVVATGLVGLLLGDETGLLVASCGLIWLVSAEGYVRKSALLRMGRVKRVAVIETIGAVLFAVLIVVAWWQAEYAPLFAAGAFLAMHAAGVVLSGGWRSAFGPNPPDRDVLFLWMTQLLAYGSANVDFIVVGVLISAGAFSVYSLGFRVAAVVTAQVSYAAHRLMVVDFGEADDSPDHQRVYDRRMKQLFPVGLGACVLTIAIAPVLPLLLGDEWRPVTGVVVVLSIAVPWRTVLGVSGALAMGASRTRVLLAWEVVRLLVTAGVLVAAAVVSFSAFVAAAAATSILTTYALHRALCAGTSVRIPRWFALATVLAAPLSLFLATLIDLTP